jgi:4-amino-4-deoxy-L-arabinose transferase-like glycosyltransferase
MVGGAVGADHGGGRAEVMPRAAAAVIGLFLLAQIPFLGTAFRIDEPNIIAIARQIEREPLAPYSFTINWIGTPHRAFDILANPPLVPAWLALWASAFGWSEISMHAAMLPFALIALIAICSIARWWGAPEWAAALLLAMSPAFFLGSQVVMPDVAMLALFLLAVAAGERYHQTGSRAAAAIGFGAGLLCPVAKYNGVLLVAVLGVLWLARGRRPLLALLAAAPVAGVVIWSAVSWGIYGQAHILVSAKFQDPQTGSILPAIAGVLGLAVIPVALPAFVRMPRGGVASLLAVGTGVLAALSAALTLEYRALESALYGISAGLVVWVVVSLLQMFSDGSREQKERAAIAGVWLIGSVVLLFGVKFISVRYLLPFAPASILLVLMRGTIRRPAFLAPAAALNVLLTAAVAIGDARTASSYRDFVAEKVAPAKRGQRLFFSGHWGFQHYMEAAGGVIMDEKKQPEWRAGDIAVIARNPFPSVREPESSGALSFTVETHELDNRWPVQTIDCAVNANFYADKIGPCRRPGAVYLPFGFRRGPSERIDIYTVR